MKIGFWEAIYNYYYKIKSKRIICSNCELNCAMTVERYIWCIKRYNKEFTK